ncbi:MAG: hypothetical protein HY721_21530 [Planctomycetes bacterium]|nr:hypothetical protein [Planctomycetota bacterium]
MRGNASGLRAALAIAASYAMPQVVLGQGELPAVEWRRIYGEEPGVSYLHSVQQSSDGGFIAAGSKRSFGPGGRGGSEASPSDTYVVKTDAEGGVHWERALDLSEHDVATCVQETAGGGYVLASEDDDLGISFLAALDGSGGLKWTRRLQGSGSAVVEAADGGFAVVGQVYGAQSDVRVAKTDLQGELLWERAFGGDRDDWGISIAGTPDGGLIAAGFSYSFSEQLQMLLIKTDGVGALVWQKTYGGSAGESLARSVWPTQDGGFIAAGMSRAFGTFPWFDLYLVRTDASGGLLWERTLGGAYDEYGYSVEETADGGFVLGAQGGGILVLKTDSEGREEWRRSFQDAAVGFGRAVRQSSDGGFIAAGQSFSGDAQLLKLSAVRPSGGPFLRGDSNDDGRTDLSDAVFALGWLFRGQAAPACGDAADSNDDGALDISDPVYLLSYLFAGGPAPPAPHPEPGLDPSLDDLGCGTL